MTCSSSLSSTPIAADTVFSRLISYAWLILFNNSNFGTFKSASGGSVILRCEGLSKSFTSIPQFSEISFSLAKGQRVGLIGEFYILKHHYINRRS